MLKKGVYYIITLLLFTACQKRYAHKPDANIVGQTPPADMVFVPGAGNVPSFYMGFTEECNMNYNIYLQWLLQVYIDYPDVYKYAVPKNRDVSDLMVMNDPYYKYYQNHPAFAYYPVVGITWLQVQDYLTWKTDRLNESVLFEVGIHDERDMLYQQNENNFNTEAYLNGQYSDAIIKRDLIDKAPEGTTRKVRMDDGIFFTAFRLPTEAEWEYVLSLEKQAQLNNDNYNNPFTKNNAYPYGKNYFTLRWGRQYDIVNDEIVQQNLPYNPAWDSSEFYAVQRLTGPADYEVGGNRIANLEGNVQEWLFDIYYDTPQVATFNMVEFFNNNTFPVLDPYNYNDADGYIDEKDSIGKLPFTYWLLDGTGTPYKTRRFGFNFITNRRVDTTYRDISEDKVIANAYHNYYLNKTDTSYSWLDTTPQSKNYYHKRYRSLYKNKTNGKFYSTQRNYDVIRPDSANHNRVVKGGTWRRPNGKARKPMSQEKHSPNVGFRCVMSYTSLPVKPKYKVKW